MLSTPRCLAILALLIASLVVLPMPAVAQENKGSGTPVNDWASLSAVRPGSKLIVKLKSGKGVEGTLTGISDTALSLAVKNQRVDLNRNDIFTVHQSLPKSAKSATLIGLAAGAGAGGVIGLAGRSDNGFEKVENAAAAGLAVVGAGAGALAGYLIGKGSRRRVLLYQAR